MTHPLGVSEHIKERMRNQRGDLRIYKDLDPSKTAFVIIDMQDAFLEPGGVIEVPSSRGIVSNINRCAQGCRDLGMPVIWIRSHAPRGRRGLEALLRSLRAPGAPRGGGRGDVRRRAAVALLP